MRRALALFVTLLVSTAWANHRDPQQPVMVDRIQMLTRIESLERALDDMMMRRSRHGRSWRLEQARAELDELKAAILYAPPIRFDRDEWSRRPGGSFSRRPKDVVPPSIPPQGPMGQDAFHALVRAITAEPFYDQKMRVLYEATVASAFTVSQVEQLMGLFTFSTEKLEVVRTVSPRIVDRENAHRLYRYFEHRSDQEALREILYG
jgi:hypothetical protein